MNKVTFAILADAVNATLVAQQKRLDAIYNANIELHGDVQPTVDVDGRLHAPYDGYLWGENVYAGGSYLSPDDTKGKNITLFNVKILIDVRLSNDFQALLGGSMGGTWRNNKGVEVGYFYAQVSKAVFTTIKNIVPTMGLSAKEKRMIVEVKEGEEVSSTVWKWSDARTWNKIMDADCDILLAEQLYSAGLNWQYEQGRKIKGKLKEWFTGMDGKMVRYEYIDDTIYA